MHSTNQILKRHKGNKYTTAYYVTITSRFEKEFAKYFGSKYAVMVNSGSSANLFQFLWQNIYIKLRIMMKQ